MSTGGANPSPHMKASVNHSKRPGKLGFPLICLAFFGTPEGTRTPDLQVRNLTFYPTELRARAFSIAKHGPNRKLDARGVRGKG